MIRFRDLLRRLGQSRRWIAVQFGLTLLLILIGLAWTRLPEKHLWQVALSLLVPLLLAISVLELQAGTVRRLADDDGRRVKLVWGALTLLVWIAVVWVSWAILDWCDDRLWNWSSYLNSQASAHWRARLFTYEHIQHWLSILEWVLRWIVVPAKVIPYAVASAQWGWRLPWRRVLLLLWNWQWWLALVLAAMLAVWLPGRFFAGNPHGTVSAQVWHVSLKLAATYLLVMSSWVMLLCWAAVLFGCQKPLPENDDATDLFKRLSTSRRWVAAQFGWIVLSVSTDAIMARLPNGLASQGSIVVPTALVMLITALVLQTGTIRSLMTSEAKRVRSIWGALSVLLWTLPVLAIAFMLDLFNCPAALRALCWIVVPAVFLPFAAASCLWAIRLPWKRVLCVLRNWRWWLAVFAAALLGEALPALFSIESMSVADPSRLWTLTFEHLASDSFTACCWVLLLGWLAVLFGHTAPPPGEALAEVPALIGPPEPGREASVKLPLP